MSRLWISENELYSRSAAKIQRSDLHSVGKKHCFIESVNIVSICKIGCYWHISLLILKHLEFLDISLLRRGWISRVYCVSKEKTSMGSDKMKRTDEKMTKKRPVERQKMRPWLMDMLKQGATQGLEWFDESQKLFKINWKHGSRHGFNTRKDASLFEKYAQHTGQSPHPLLLLTPPPPLKIPGIKKKACVSCF